jgi:hypothetical protein
VDYRFEGSVGYFLAATHVYRKKVLDPFTPKGKIMKPATCNVIKGAQKAGESTSMQHAPQQRMT